MPICGMQAKGKKASGLNATVGDWFDCYTDCAVNSAIKCFIRSTECLYNCKLPQNPEQNDNNPQTPVQYDRRNYNYPPEMTGRSVRREALRKQFMENSRQNLQGLSFSPCSDSSSCCNSLSAPLSLPLSSNSADSYLSNAASPSSDRIRSFASTAECPIGIDSCDNDDEADAMFLPGFGFGMPFGMGGFGMPFGMGGFGMPGFGFGGFGMPGFGMW